MVDGYVLLIANTDRTGSTIERVPAFLKPAVLAKLAALGLDGYGRPLPEEQPEQPTEPTEPTEG